MVSGIAHGLDFRPSRVAEIEIAVTEIGTNLVKHAREGTIVVRTVRGMTEVAVEVLAMDRGPGIDDLRSALRDGASSTGTLGVGLGAVLRLSDSCDIHSQPGAGTEVAVRFHARRGPIPEMADRTVAGLTRPIAGEEVCGDAYAVRRNGQRALVMMCDGSGHGPLAARASAEAVRLFHAAPDQAPETVVRMLHDGLRGTRGGAVAVADLDFAAGRARFAGLGNIAGSVLSEGRKQGMVSAPGVAGYQARTIRAFDYPLPPDAVVVLHSDGLTERWSGERRERLLTESPLIIAAALLREAATRPDDAGILIAKGRP
ncbi:transcriptional regulator [Pseudonocardiaceae bacterium YIM PH 21723]|nr:transcriptional regulator [Pseudonocardiaceae bacterium YIM PH 21723]